MTKEEIETYCLTGFGICVYRQRIKKAQFIIQNIIIMGKNENSRSVHVEFDPIGMIGQGEGIRWAADCGNLDQIIESVEVFSGKDLGQWQNYTKSGFEPYYSSETLTESDYQNSWKVFEHKYENGLLLLPSSLEFKCLSILS